MPRLSAFQGIVIYMYMRDHGIAHFHARYGDHEAVVGITAGSAIQGGLPPRQARLVREWAGLHRDELHQAWARATSGEPPGTIDPLP
ncbi:MAG: DUF4160 domain-containing protein [Actinobacteria bacterium]|nr:DUF4160 domain-containing protein [Actinomycetota bacterium]